MPPEWGGDITEGGWSWNTSEQENRSDQPAEQTAVGWNIGDGWGPTETSAGNASKLDTQTVATWGVGDVEWGPSNKAPAERKPSTSSTKSFDPLPISPQEDLPRRSSTWESVR
jgi:hypothetical protein